jgi:hypothetical protein
MEPGKASSRRCAIYTRKSSEEGLEQDFNSLHAQREACESYIKSQQGEGWRLVKVAYDDGGLSRDRRISFRTECLRTAERELRRWRSSRQFERPGSSPSQRRARKIPSRHVARAQASPLEAESFIAHTANQDSGSISVVLQQEPDPSPANGGPDNACDAILDWSADFPLYRSPPNRSRPHCRGCRWCAIRRRLPW